MSVRAFKYFSILVTNTPQPLIGTTLNAAFTVKARKQSDPPLQLTVPVVDSSPFLPGDDVCLLSPTGTLPLTCNVAAVPDSTHLTIQGQLTSYPTGSYVSLGLQCNSPYVQAKDGNAGTLWIGSSWQMNPTTGLYCIAKLIAVGSGTQPFDFSSVRPGFADPEPLNNYWIAGTSGDQYLPSANLV
jgi:hypothetical protein